MGETDTISRQAAIEAINGMIDRFERLLADIRESKVDDSVCGMCEYDGAYIGPSGDWCNECPGFDKDDCFKLSDRCRKRWMGDIVLPSAQPDRKLIDDYMWKIKQNISPHTAAEGVVAIKYYLEQIYEQIYGKGERPKWMI